MKITKHILKLAEATAREEIKGYHRYTEENDLEWLKNSYAAQLNNIKEALLKGRFYAGVIKRSASGMSRTIKLAYIKNNRLYTIHNPNFLKLAGCDKNGRIGGCGMDMLFHAQYTLFHNLHSNYKQAHYQKRMPQYNNL